MALRPNSVLIRKEFGSGIVTDTLGYDVYADILASTISTLRTPSNVGVFAGWGCGKSYLLHKIQDILAERCRNFRTARGRPLMCIWLLLRLIFFDPPEAIRNPDEVRFIPAYFNALEYAGSDNLWAGLVTRLVSSIEFGIGRLPSAIFRSKPIYFSYDDIYTRDEEKLKFRPKTLCGRHFPLYALVLMAVCVCLSGGIVLLTFALNRQAFLMAASTELSPNSTGSNPVEDNVQKSSLVLGTIILSMPFVAGLKNFFPILVKFIRTQQQIVSNLFKKPDFSKELGVMAKVKREIRHATRLVRFMELFEGRRIVVTIFIDELDKLPQANIAPLLQTIKILLSDNESRFVSIIAMDPYYISTALESGIQSQFPAIQISGHKFLKHFIQVPFCIPEMNRREQELLLGTLVENHRLSRSEVEFNKHLEDKVDGGPSPSRKNKVKKKKPQAGSEVLEGLLISDENKKEEMIPLVEMRDLFKPLDAHSDVITACDCVMAELRDPKIFGFIKNNLQEMKRLVGIVKVTTRVIFSRLILGKDAGPCLGETISPVGITPFHLAAWLVLVAQWPYRMTWVIQQVEDKRDAEHQYDLATTLIDVYRDVERHFTLAQAWRKLIKLDEDPDTLERFLDSHSDWLNVEFLSKLVPYTISLDSSLKSVVAWTSVERDARSVGSFSGKRPTHMDVTDVIDMLKTVCKDSQRLEEYEKKLIDQNITGIVLLRGDLEELKRHLDMALGDWVQFSHAVMQLRTYHKFSSG